MLVPIEALPAPSSWRHLGTRLRFAARRVGLTPALAAAWAWFDRRPAVWARLAGRLKGPYAKLGQLASLRIDVLAPEDQDALRSLRREVPPLPWPAIRALLEEELGPLGRRFAAIDPEPLGAASVAQAHRARLADGREVVVKVQYPWLQAAAGRDLAWVSSGLRRRFGLDAATLDAFGASYRRELDFREEAGVAAAIAANLTHERQVLVPTVVPEASTARVLCVEHWPAIPIDDHATLDARGVSRIELAEILGRAYAQMIFVDGRFHADPHAGNLLVVDEPSMAGCPRILFVDFGLAEALDPTLRRALRDGLHALLRQDRAAFVARMSELGMIAPGAEDGVRAAVDTMFARLRDEGSPLGMGGERILALKDEAKRLLSETPGLALPPTLLLYARTVSTLFQLAHELAPEVDLMKVVVPSLLRFLASKE